MHIALVIYESLDSVSGGYLYDRQLVHYLQSQGDTVEVISLPWRSYGRHLLDNGSDHLRSLLRFGKYDIILQDELNHPSLFRLNRDLRQQPAPIVSIVHHLRSSEDRPDWQNTLYRQVERQYLTTIDACVANSRTTAESVGALLSAPIPTLVAYPGRDHIAPQVSAERIGLRSAERPLRVLFVGNIIRRKGLHDLIAALAQLPTSLWALDIVGDEQIEPDYTAEIDRLISQLPPDAEVKRFGRLDKEALESRFAAAHVLAVPSTYEGFGIVYVEGFGYGLPAIGTTSGAAGEVIEDNLSGFLIASGDVKHLAQCLHELATDRDKLMAMGLQSLSHFAEFPTWEESAARIRNFISKQIARKAAQA